MTETDKLNEKLKAAGQELLKCDVCGATANLAGVCSVPGNAVSVCYCIDCINANAHPWWIMVASTAVNGGYDFCAEWWKDMINSTIKRLAKTREQFDKEVNEAIQEQEGMFHMQEDAKSHVPTSNKLICDASGAAPSGDPSHDFDVQTTDDGSILPS